jgi:hypothetical protein
MKLIHLLRNRTRATRGSRDPARLDPVSTGSTNPLSPARLSLGLVRYSNRKQRPWVSKASTRRLRTSAPRQQDIATPVTILVQHLVRLLRLIKFHGAPYEPVALGRVE